MPDNGEVVDFPTDEYKGLDLNTIEVEEADPIVSTPDPSKSKREKPKKEPKPPKKTATTYRAGKYVKPMQEFYGFAALGLAPFDPTCAQALMQSAESCAKAWDNAARTNTAIRRMLESLTTGTAYSQLIAAHLPIVIAVLSHHKPEMVPEMFRVSPNESEVNKSDQRAA